ncbi:1-acyl-sn-glycerol-3-phosphate acyltransferase [Candidatus Pacearchaeota archaeon]|nr:1-acyl-sn-glycerol-3-phosphate acyltransferase [Candidatus Pacearchaeota archaeon]
MKINQKKVDKISYGLGIKYLWWFLEDYKILGEKNLEKITEKKILYLPNHVSHFDYILIPHILNRHKIPHPAIVAGENINSWPINKLFSEETGAIFVDRGKIENGKFWKKKESLIKLKKDIGEVVFEGYSLMPFIEGTRGNGLNVMKDPKERYLKEYFYQILKQNKNSDDYIGINIAINYKPHVIEKPFSKCTQFFKGKFFLLYFGLDLFSFATQPIRKKPTAYINLGEPYPLKEFIEKQDSRGLVDYVGEDVKKLFREIK